MAYQKIDSRGWCGVISGPKLKLPGQVFTINLNGVQVSIGQTLLPQVMGNHGQVGAVMQALA